MKEFWYNLFLMICLSFSIWYNIYQYRIINCSFEKCGTSTIFNEAKIDSMIQSLEEGSDDKGA